jgi:hypothetical protein
MEIETGVPLSRLTTIGTGGPAAALGRPATLPELEEAVAWAAERGMEVVTIGLGSNVLAADEGVDDITFARRLQPDARDQRKHPLQIVRVVEIKRLAKTRIERPRLVAPHSGNANRHGMEFNPYRSTDSLRRGRRWPGPTKIQQRDGRHRWTTAARAPTRWFCAAFQSSS